MRVALALPLIAISSEAWAATVNREDTYACRDLGEHLRLERLMGAGHKDAMIPVMVQALHAKRCVFLPRGLAVQIEDATRAHVCVAKAGAKAPCLWVHRLAVDQDQ
jgi:hypothetical protein